MSEPEPSDAALLKLARAAGETEVASRLLAESPSLNRTRLLAARGERSAAATAQLWFGPRISFMAASM